MADNYNMFSEMIEDLTPEEVAWITALLDNHGDGLTGDALKAWCEERGLAYCDDDQAMTEYQGYWPAFEWSIEARMDGGQHLWLYSEDGFDSDHLVGFVQSFFLKFREDAVFTYTASATCSKPRLGEFGGMWMAITATDLRAGDTWSAASDAVEALAKKKWGKKNDKKAKG